MNWDCRCGKRFRSYGAEAFHRHNFPALCRSPRVRKPKSSKKLEDHVRRAPGDDQARELLQSGTRTGRFGPRSGHIEDVEK